MRPGEIHSQPFMATNAAHQLRTYGVELPTPRLENLSYAAVPPSETNMLSIDDSGKGFYAASYIDKAAAEKPAMPRSRTGTRARLAYPIGME